MIAGECGSQYPSNVHTGIRRTRDLGFFSWEGEERCGCVVDVVTSSMQI
jgi:hypothetical protein